MKSIIQNTIVFICLFISLLAKGQVPQLFNYQGIARDVKGNPLTNQVMSVKLSIMPASDALNAEYEETQRITTNEFGLYTLQIGNGKSISGSMSQVKWETGNKYIKVAIDANGGENFIEMGTNQLLSVPYAIYADKAGTAANNGHDKTRTGAVNSNAAHVAGDVNYLTKFTALNTIGKSLIYDNGTRLGIGTTTPAAGTSLHMLTTTGNIEHIRMQNSNSTGFGKFIMYNDNASNYATFTKYGSAYPGGYPSIGSLFPYANMLAFGNNLGPFLLANNGNVGIGIVTAGTTKLYFNAQQSTGYLGLGSSFTPAANVHIGNTSTGDTLRITNATTGHLATDGFEIGNTGNQAFLLNKENSNIVVGINSTPAILTLTSAGNTELSGQLKIAGGAPGAGKILSSDASGLASWNTAAALGVISGSGTTNAVPKFTPNGVSLGNSIISDNGNEVSLGNSPGTGSVLNIGGAVNSDTSAISFRTAGQLGTIFVNSLGQLQFTPNNSNPALGNPTLTLDDDGGGATFEDNVEVKGRVGVGTTSPIAKIHVISGGQIDTAIFATTSSGNNRQVGVFGTYNTSGYGAGVVGRGFGGSVPPALTDIGVYGSSGGIGVWSAGTLRVSGSSEAVGKTLTCTNASGDAVWSAGLGFRATGFNAAINVGASVTVVYPNEAFDDGAGYNNATGEFTAPEAGIYTFNYSSTHQALAAYTTGNVFTNFEVNGVLLTGSAANFEPSKITFWTMQNTATIKLAAGDKVNVRCDNNTNVNLNANVNNTFNGYKVR